MKNNLLALILLPIVIAAALQLCGCSNEVRTNSVDYDPGNMYTQLLQECDEMEQVEWMCLYPGVERTDTDHALCRARAYAAAEWETCAEAAHYEIKCMTRYFYGQLRVTNWCEETPTRDISLNLHDVCYVEFWTQEHLTDCPSFW